MKNLIISILIMFIIICCLQAKEYVIKLKSTQNAHMAIVNLEKHLKLKFVEHVFSNYYLFKSLDNSSSIIKRSNIELNKSINLRDKV